MRISSRMTLHTLAAVIFTVALLSAYFAQEMKQALVDGEVRNQQAQLDLRVQHFNSGIEQLRSDALLISESPFIVEWFKQSINVIDDANDQISTNTSLPSNAYSSLIEQSFNNLLTRQPDYFQARILSISGDELIRVERQNGVVKVVAAKQLQDKSDTEYFEAAKTLSAGEVYLSDINLNEEYGAIAQPEVTTLRAAAPIFGDNGKLLGVFVINKNVGSFVRATVTNSSVGDVFVLNARGHFIYHPQNEYTFSEQRGTDYTFAKQWPEIAKSLLVAFEKDAFNLATSSLNLDNYVVNARKVSYHKGTTPKYISIIQMAPSSHFSEQTIQALQRQIFAVALLLAVCIALAWFFNRIMVKRIYILGELSNYVAAGGRDLKLPEERGDEVDHVVKAFQSMVDQIDGREKLLHLEKVKIQAIFDAVNSGLITTNEEGYIEEVNQFGAHLLTSEPKTMEGKFIGDYLKSESSINPNVFQAYFALQQEVTQPFHFEVIGLRHTGPFPVQLSVARFTLDRKTFYVGAIEDISERKSIQLSLDKYAKKLEASNNELQSFAYVASHDLQEPVRKIQSFGELLEREEKANLSENGQLYLSRMVAAAERMRSLISSLLELSRVGKDQNQCEWVDVELQCREIIDDLEKLITEKKAEVSIGPLPHVWGEPVQMRRLMQNLIGNALKYVKVNVHPVVEVGVYCPMDVGNELALELEQYPVAFFVQDNGIGIAPEFREKIFVAFERLHGRSQYQGNGIGLAICKKIVEGMGGIIFVDDNPAGGSRFVVALPKAGPES
ncbi:sensor histidine kinase [Saccharophagus degradans]|uniref:histidine kinase n=1 Tax=Saccharophagus degradans TaxID=86304 RepID=A0AAW7XCY4_9GAMM|nr:ATP-binding protein [Saccharophagus degradans]MDO6424613.1 ATP-binding protein [Saccharophagus degradans]MDO6608946.1 ATP-binding protein [Saccharophagus degradans]